MNKSSLNLNAPINGIYLNAESIDLLSIIQCKRLEDLKDFVKKCVQLNVSEQDISKWDNSNIEDVKKDLVSRYKKSLVSQKDNITDRRNVIRNTLNSLGISTKEKQDEYILEFQRNGYEGIKQKLKAEYPKEYGLISNKNLEFISSERDQMKSVSYEELEQINNELPNYNTILVGEGRYHQVVNKLYDEKDSNSKKYNFYHEKRGLDFCVRNGKNARYHTLLDKQTMEDHFKGKSKDEIVEELKGFVKASVDFISEYNQENKVNGKGIITSVDLFNEIISFDPPYKNMWQELHGISTQELTEIFEYAKEHKPDGVKYVYNEPFLENPERRKAVIEQLLKINELSPRIN